MRKLKLLGRKLLIERLPEVEETRSGLFLPSSAREKPQLGKVIAIGAKVPFQSLVQIGQTVMFPKFHDRYIIIDDKELLIIEDHELLLMID